MPKIICIILTSLLITTIGYSQNSYGDDFPKAEVTSNNINSDTTEFSFISNYYIDAYKAPMLEGRMLNRYSEIINIHIDYESQKVTFKTLNVGAEVFLEKFVTHFKYKGYEIH